ncbi:MAG: chlorite dismutase family protein [Rhodothermales bacterium]|nr:chlorite dismutase family protein [Rhodothermales bacterium]MBO6778715.1 chlorite dismutase family protein [Rhodothermales bacterium]
MALEIAVEKPSGINVAEKGRNAEGETTYLDARLFMQLQVFTGARSLEPLQEAMEDSGLGGTLYADVLNPQGVGLLTYSQDPSWFVDGLRNLLNAAPFSGLTRRPEMTMTGRTYSIGYEKDLEDVLLRRPVRHACNPAWPWVIWYPLRRSGEFSMLSADEQRTMLMEHGGIGRAYGKADLAHDVRLSCHGLDQNDNDFLVALMGKELAPLSKVVEHMRSTRQTAGFITQMGPFFVGKAVWQRARMPGE